MDILKFILMGTVSIGFIFIIIYYAIKQWKGTETIIINPEAEVVEVDNIDVPVTNNLIVGIKKGIDILNKIKSL